MTNFDDRAKDWDSDPMKVQRARIVADAIRAAVDIQPGMSALEIGCGTGLLSFALREDFASITLADTSQGMLDVLSDKIEAAKAANMRPLRLDLVVDPLPAERFDVVYSLMALHHIPDTDRILRRFSEVLNPGGWLAVADLDKEDGSFHTDGSADIHHGFERHKLQKQVEAAGFTNVHFSNVYTIHKTIGNEPRAFPLFLMMARKRNYLPSLTPAPSPDGRWERGSRENVNFSKSNSSPGAVPSPDGRGEARKMSISTKAIRLQAQSPLPMGEG